MDGAAVKGHVTFLVSIREIGTNPQKIADALRAAGLTPTMISPVAVVPGTPDEEN